MNSKSPAITATPQTNPKKPGLSQTAVKKRPFDDSEKRREEKGSSDSVKLGAAELQAYINRLV